MRIYASKIDYFSPVDSLDFSQSLSTLKAFSQKQAEVLKSELQLYNLRDLLHFIPRRYVDRTRFFKIDEIKNCTTEVQVVGIIERMETVKTRLIAHFRDHTGSMQLVWFRIPKWLPNSLKIGEPCVIFGKCTSYGGVFQMAHPEIELLSKYESKPRPAMQAIYHSTEKLGKHKIYPYVISHAIREIFHKMKGYTIAETLSDDIRYQLQLISKYDALIDIHFPKDQIILGRAQFRLKFEELYFVQLRLLHRNISDKKNIEGIRFNRISDFFNSFYKKIPFELTNAQKRVLKEIRRDVGSGLHMNRLLQGDVGSGKTIVSFMTALMALDNGYQSCILAPTEILAIQHYNSFLELTYYQNINIALLTGSTREKSRKTILEQLNTGIIHVIIGTHALLEDRVVFKNLGLVVVDEQHRFGVAQRAKLRKKNNTPPHILVMTATPIPRTLAMSLYGDLDISTIDELPPGRKSIKTIHRYDPNHRLQILKFIRDEIKKGRQVYVVYPLIEESDKLDYKNLMEGYHSLDREFPMPEYNISVVHGQMKPEDKDYEMTRFAKGITDIMVATTVIEVGVNIPNASVMIIESAERFGLSQLHQLRGRVGRGSEQSYCVLVTPYKLSSDARTRVETMVNTNDGFRIAEVDLKLRGPGDLMGTQQSGILQLKIADIVKDGKILTSARQYAIDTLKEDPELQLPKNKMIKLNLSRISENKEKWDLIS